MFPERSLVALARPLVALALLAGTVRAQQLEIHYINVGWGGAVLLRGPDGTTVLLEGGRTGKGTNAIVPYLQSIGITPAVGLDYMILGHRHNDHVGGLDEVIQAGYDVHVANYENGSSTALGAYDAWVLAAQGTTAGAPVPMPLGAVIPLGGGAKLTCVARNAQIIGGASLSVSDENSRSIAVLVQHGGFDFLWASDLTGGTADQACTGRGAPSVDVETPLIQAISPGGASPLISAGGIDVLHCNHHGAEDSTNANYLNLAQPAVALISIGAGQGLTDQRPRIDVVEHVLLAQVPCVTAAPVLVLQTEEGYPAGTYTSYEGFSVGNIRVATDGVSSFTVSADGQVTVGPDERVAAGLPRTLPLDNADRTPPLLTDVGVPSVMASQATIAWKSDELSSSLVRYGLTAAYGASASTTGLLTNHVVALTGLTPARLYYFRVESTDQAGNTAASAGTFHTGSIANYAPTAVTLLQGTLKSGTAAQLAADDNAFYVVNSTTSATKTTDWYGTAAVPVPLAPGALLSVIYAGKNSKAATQSLHLWDWSGARWVQLDSRKVSGELLVTLKPTSQSTYLSATGEIRLRVLGTRTQSFTASGDLLRVSVESPGSVP